MLDGSRFNLMDEGSIAHDDDRQKVPKLSAINDHVK
jgi:hypothetical protein